MSGQFCGAFPINGKHSVQQLLIVIVFTLITGVVATSAAASTLEQQRKLYTQAKQQLSSGQISNYRKTKLRLEGYPLLAYLEYQEMRRVIAQPTRLLPPVNAERLKSFEKQYPGFPLRRALRQNWLWSLAKLPNKGSFIRHYQDVKDRNLFCSYLTAKVASGALSAATKSVKRHWETYGPPAKGCNEEVTQLIKADRLSNNWLVERLLLAMRDGNTKEVKYLSTRLPRGSAFRAKSFLATDKDPRDRNAERVTVARSGRRSGDDSLYTRLTIIHGIKKYARRDATAANDQWQVLSPRYNFRQIDREAVQDTLADRAARQKKSQASQWLDAIPANRLTKSMRDNRLKIALRNNDWHAVLTLARRLPSDVRNEPQWQYWQARSAEAVGDKRIQPKKLYQKLAALEHDEYYAFLAADRLNRPYNLKQRKTPTNRKLLNRLSARADIARTKELLAIGKKIDARREWWALQQRLSKNEQRQSATLAQQWGWHRQAIGVLSTLGERGDLQLRYPLPWQNIMEPNARKNEIPTAWSFGILRAESMYQADAKSGAGAYGLMQLMPPTAKQTAKRSGVRLRRNKELFQPATNIPLGTYYLGQLMNRFEGHAAVSTAAYNAGPNRVQQWLPTRNNVPVDIWVETIPYNETRRYVKKVMQYATVFDWRLRGEKQPSRMSTLMPEVTPRGGNLAMSR